MSITMSLYQVSDDINVMGKSIPTPTSTHTILLKDGCSVDNPVVTFSAVASAIAPLNYAYIDSFGRYYYITDRKSLVNGVVELTLESDPLQSFKTEIGNCDAIVRRQENDANGYLQDDQYNAMAYEAVATQPWPKSIDDFSFILMTVG